MCDVDLGAAPRVGQAAVGDHDQQDRVLVPERPVHGAHDREQSRRDPDILTSLNLCIFNQRTDRVSLMCRSE